MWIYHSNIQNHFSLKLNSFGELKFYITARVLCVCVWPKLRSCNSNSTKKRGIHKNICQDKSVWISHSNIQNHFSLKLSSFGKLKFYIIASAGRSSAYTSPLIRSLIKPDLSQIEMKKINMLRKPGGQLHLYIEVNPSLYSI